MAQREAKPAPTHGTDATAARLKEVATEGGKFTVNGMTAYSSRRPDHAWAIFSTTTGPAVAYIEGIHQWVRRYPRTPGGTEQAHDLFVDVSRSQLARERAREEDSGGVSGSY